MSSPISCLSRGSSDSPSSINMHWKYAAFGVMNIPCISINLVLRSGILQRQEEVTLRRFFVDRTSSIVRSLIICITLSLILIWLWLSVVVCSKTFVNVSTPPCSTKVRWASGKFRSSVDKLKRRRKRIFWSTSLVNRRDKHWTKPRFNPFVWTFGFLNEIVLVQECVIIANDPYPWKAAPNESAAK